MQLLKILSRTGLLLILSMGLSSCSSVVFPNVDAEDDPVFAQETSEPKVVEEGKTLTSDEKNVAYTDDAKDDSKVVANEEADEIISSAKVTPVIESEPVEDASLLAADSFLQPEAEPEVEDNTPSITYQLETFYFEDGSAVLGANYNKNIREIVKLAKQNDAQIMIYGHSSSRTRNMDPVSHKVANFEISMKRAENVAKSLVRAGLPKSKITVEALADTYPAYLEVMPEGERLNRRVEVYISY